MANPIICYCAFTVDYCLLSTVLFTSAAMLQCVRTSVCTPITNGEEDEGDGSRWIIKPNIDT